MTGEGMDGFCRGLFLAALRMALPWLLLAVALVALTRHLLT